MQALLFVRGVALRRRARCGVESQLEWWWQKTALSHVSLAACRCPVETCRGRLPQKRTTSFAAVAIVEVETLAPTLDADFERENGETGNPKILRKVFLLLVVE